MPSARLSVGKTLSVIAATLVSALTLIVMACDGGSQELPDIDATVEARVALAEASLVAPTAAPLPTYTPMPTYTPAPTAAPIPSATPVPYEPELSDYLKGLGNEYAKGESPIGPNFYLQEFRSIASLYLINIALMGEPSTRSGFESYLQAYVNGNPENSTPINLLQEESYRLYVALFGALDTANHPAAPYIHKLIHPETAREAEVVWWALKYVYLRQNGAFSTHLIYGNTAEDHRSWFASYIVVGNSPGPYGWFGHLVDGFGFRRPKSTTP